MDDLEALRARKREELERQLSDSKAAAGAPITLTDDTFWDVVRGSPVVLVDFWAAWCGPCRAVAPSVEALAKEYAGRLAVGKLNVDENRRIPSEFGVRSIPTLIIFKDGKPVDGVVGAAPKAMLEEKIRRWL